MIAAHSRHAGGGRHLRKWRVIVAKPPETPAFAGVTVKQYFAGVTVNGKLLTNGPARCGFLPPHAFRGRNFKGKERTNG